MKTLVFTFFITFQAHSMPFFKQAHVDANLKTLIKNKEYKKAFEIIKDNQLHEQNINVQLRYDILNKLSGIPKKVFYCQKMLDKYPKSYSVLVEACRYIKSQKLKFGTLNQLIERTKKEQAHILHLIKALKDIQVDKKQ